MGAFQEAGTFPALSLPADSFPAGQVSVLFHFLIDCGAGRGGLQENFEKSS